MAFKKAINSPIFSEISNYCSNNNIECYVVGGFVRDFFLNRECKDVDILIIGDGISAAKKIANTIDPNISVTVFKNFGTAYFKYKEYEIEFVGSRKESYVSSSRNPIVQSGTLEDDINRRDFKINSIAISLNKHNFGELVDLHDGLSDINQKIINTPLDSNITFSDDPLRMLRAIRFSCQLDFEIHPELINTMTKLKERISIITSERIIDEINKIILTKTPSEGFKILEKTGLLKLIIPELTNLKGIDEIEGQKHKDNFYHTLEVLDNICLNTNNLWLRWAALLHDIGKAPTKKFNKKIGWTFHGHEFEGSKMVYKLFKRLKMPLNDKMKYVQKLVLMSLCEADITTKNKNRFKKYHDNFRVVREKIITVEEKDNIRNFQPPISGAEIMKVFNLSPCKTIGIIKENIKEAILEGVIGNNYEEAYKLMIEEGEKLGLSDGK